MGWGHCNVLATGSADETEKASLEALSSNLADLHEYGSSYVCFVGKRID